MSSINEFKDRLVGGGARANLFRVRLAWPGSNPLDLNKAEFLIKAASLPASIIGEIDVPYRGRMLKVPGDRSYEDWSVTVINDNDMSIRKAMESWMNAINANVANVSAFTNPMSEPGGLYRRLEVDQLNRQNQPVRTYTFENAFPKAISAIELSYETNNAIEDFTVTFAYSHWITADVN